MSQKLTPYLLDEGGDVDAPYGRAVAAGAEIREEPEDLPDGDRRDDAYDPEGQRWSARPE